MAYTLQSVADKARQSLNDDAADRWTDSELVEYMQDALSEAYRFRPDLFIGQYSTFDPSALVIGSDFPIHDTYARLVIDYVIARAESKDAEEASDGRAAAYLKIFREGL